MIEKKLHFTSQNLEYPHSIWPHIICPKDTRINKRAVFITPEIALFDCILSFFLDNLIFFLIFAARLQFYGRKGITNC